MNLLTVFLFFFATAAITGLIVWALLAIVGWQNTAIIVAVAVAFGAGATLIEYITERR